MFLKVTNLEGKHVFRETWWAFDQVHLQAYICLLILVGAHHPLLVWLGVRKPQLLPQAKPPPPTTTTTITCYKCDAFVCKSHSNPIVQCHSCMSKRCMHTDVLHLVESSWSQKGTQGWSRMKSFILTQLNSQLVMVWGWGCWKAAWCLAAWRSTWQVECCSQAEHMCGVWPLGGMQL